MKRHPKRKQGPSNTVEYVSKDLAHFVGQGLPDGEPRYLLLKAIITTGWLLPSALHEAYRGIPNDGVERLLPVYQHTVDFTKGLSSNSKYLASVVCFCDIPEGSLGRHTGVYGRFGVSLSKSLLVPQGATPVFYVARQSLTHERIELQGPHHGEHLSRAALFDSAERSFTEPTRQQRGVPNSPPRRLFDKFLEAYLFPFVKFFDTDLPQGDETNYYMEREWRVLGPVGFRKNDLQRVYVPREYEKRIREDLSLPGSIVCGL